MICLRKYVQPISRIEDSANFWNFLTDQSFFFFLTLFLYTCSPKNYKTLHNIYKLFITLYTMYMTFSFTMLDFAAQFGGCGKSIMPNWA